MERAIQATCSRFPEIEGAETALHQWTSAEAFVDFFERVEAGERDFDDEIVGSFIDEGEFYLPAEGERTALAREIVAAFISELSGALYGSDDGLPAFANRVEALHIDTKRHMDIRFADLEAKFSSLSSPAAVPDEPTASGTLSNPAHRKLAAKIDFARGLIDRGLVRSARAELERVENEAGEVPTELKFRIVTNLGACALAQEDLHDACALLEEAHRLWPENQKGIANAALAAHLSNDSERALALAHKARALDARNSQATAVVIGELWEADDIERLEDLIAAEDWITRDHQCSLVLAGIRVQQAHFEEAVTLCHSLVETDPDDADAHLALSECLFNYAQADRHLLGYTNELIGRLLEAETEATQAVDLLQATELRKRSQRALVVRACARAIRGETDEAMRDFDEVLSEVPTHPDAAFNKGLFLLYEGRPEESRSVLEGIRDPERRADATLPLSDACLATGDAAAAVRLLKGTLKLDCPSWEDVHRAEILCKAEAMANDADSVAPVLEGALERHPDDPKLLTLAALCRNPLDDPVGLENSLIKALKRASEADRRAILVHLGIHYQSLGRFSEAADQFAEVVDDVASHPAAIPLLICLTQSNRFREALEWGRRIRESNRHPPRMVIEVQTYILDQAGDVHAALACLNNLCSRTDSTPVDQVRLATAQFRCGERDAARRTVLGISSSELCHDPQSILLLAQLKRLLSTPGYLEDAYLARRCGLNDPTVHLGYFVMFIGREKGWAEPSGVGPGCAVRLKSESSEQWWQILDDGEESRGPHELPSNHELAQQLIGKRVGDTIVLRKDLEDLSYKVEVIQSKFVRAFQETSEEFSTRFPAHTGLSRVRVEDSDFTKIFRSVDQRNQVALELERMYLGGRLPFVSFSSLLGRSALEVWRACTATRLTSIRFGTGADEDASRADDLLREADCVVLDMLALLTVHELGLAEHLRMRFRSVAVCQFVIDELQKTHDSTVIESAPKGWLGKAVDGRHTLTEMTEGNWKEWTEFVRTVLEFAESFERIASYPILEADDREALIDTLTRAGAGAIYAGDDQGAAKLVVVSDDLGLSGVARFLGIDTVNTQAVLWELHRSNGITGEAYSSWIERLASLNYWFVRVRSEDIIRRLKANGYMTTDGTRAMIKTLEGPDCSEDSAVSVGAEVIISLAGSAPREQVDLILSLVIETLRRGRDSSPVLLKFRNTIASRLSLAPPARDQLLQTVDLYIRL